MSRTGYVNALPLRQKLDVLSLSCVAGFIHVGLQLLRLKRTARILGVTLGLTDVSIERPNVPGEIGLSVRERARLDIAMRVLRRGPFDSSCLRRSLLAGYVLRRHDHAIRMGVRAVDGHIAAHAWLEVDGVSLEPSSDESFGRLVTVPGRKS